MFYAYSSVKIIYIHENVFIFRFLFLAFVLDLRFRSLD